jgi:hypothetical protein
MQNKIDLPLRALRFFAERRNTGLLNSQRRSASSYAKDYLHANNTFSKYVRTLADPAA